ncbi:TPA: hypothetical protein QIF36_004147 [Enterobacter kobei]|nr:hypothetical protein [Enterobacter kobei]
MINKDAALLGDLLVHIKKVEKVLLQCVNRPVLFLSVMEIVNAYVHMQKDYRVILNCVATQRLAIEVLLHNHEVARESSDCVLNMAEDERDRLLMAIAGTSDGRSIDPTSPAQAVEQAISIIKQNDAELKQLRAMEELPFTSADSAAWTIETNEPDLGYFIYSACNRYNDLLPKQGNVYDELVKSVETLTATANKNITTNELIVPEAINIAGIAMSIAIPCIRNIVDTRH